MFRLCPQSPCASLQELISSEGSDAAVRMFCVNRFFSSLDMYGDRDRVLDRSVAVVASLESFGTFRSSFFSVALALALASSLLALKLASIGACEAIWRRNFSCFLRRCWDNLDDMTSCCLHFLSYSTPEKVVLTLSFW